MHSATKEEKMNGSNVDPHIFLFVGGYIILLLIFVYVFNLWKGEGK